MTTRIHGLLDYLVGSWLIISPASLGFERGRAESRVPVLLGAGAIGYSVITNYEFGLVRRLPMPVHLALDALSGIVMAASPWLFGFAGRVWVPHVVFGLFEVGAALSTEGAPRQAPAPARSGSQGSR
jgi:hypothetical protein